MNYVIMLRPYSGQDKGIAHRPYAGVDTVETATAVVEMMRRAFASAGLPADVWFEPEPYVYGMEQ